MAIIKEGKESLEAFLTVAKDHGLLPSSEEVMLGGAVTSDEAPKALPPGKQRELKIHRLKATQAAQRRLKDIVAIEERVLAEEDSRAGTGPVVDEVGLRTPRGRECRLPGHASSRPVPAPACVHRTCVGRKCCCTLNPPHAQLSMSCSVPAKSCPF